MNSLQDFDEQCADSLAFFLGVGAYTASILASKTGLTFLLTIPLAGLSAALFGFLFGFGDPAGVPAGQAAASTEGPSRRQRALRLSRGVHSRPRASREHGVAAASGLRR